METADDNISWTEYRLTVHDFINAQRLHRAPTWRKVLIIALAWAATLSTVVFITSHDLKVAAVTFLLWLPFVLLFGYVWVWLALRTFVPRQARRVYDNYPLVHGTTRLALRPEALHAQGEHGESKYPWSGFIKWRANEKIVLAYLAPNLFVMIPARIADLGFPVEDLKTVLAHELGPQRQ